MCSADASWLLWGEVEAHSRRYSLQLVHVPAGNIQVGHSYKTESPLKGTCDKYSQLMHLRSKFSRCILLSVMSDESAGSELPLVDFRVFKSANLSTELFGCTRQQKQQHVTTTTCYNRFNWCNPQQSRTDYNDETQLQGGPKDWHTIIVRLNFTKY